MGENVGDRFRSRIPTAGQIEDMDTIRRAMIAAAEAVAEFAPAGREAALALTKLEEAAMWANKAITHGAPR